MMLCGLVSAILKMQWAARHLGPISSSADSLDSKEQHSQMFTHVIPTRPKEITGGINMSSFLMTVIRSKRVQGHPVEVNKFYGKS
jgi:hypothetical protein